jgi:hypothetical protein
MAQAQPPPLRLGVISALRSRVLENEGLVAVDRRRVADFQVE